MLRMLLLFCTVSGIVPCCVLCMFFHFFHVFLQGEPGLPGLPGTSVRFFYLAFPNYVALLHEKRRWKYWVRGFHWEMFLNTFDYLLKKFLKVKTFEEGMWQVPTRRCSATVLGDCEVKRSVLEAMNALPQVHQTEQYCDRTVWFLTVVELIASGPWYIETVKVIKANEISVLSSWVSLTWTECVSWGRRRKRQFLIRGNDLSLACIWGSPAEI